MITLTALGTHGRLGNQLFQYAFLIGVSKKYKLPIHLPNLRSKVANNQPCMLESFCVEYAELNESSITQTRTEIELKTTDTFDTYNPQNIVNITPGTNFFGLYQSYRYWEEYKDEVKKQFKLKDNTFVDYAKNYIKHRREMHGKPVVALHLRRGDVTQWYDYTQYRRYLNTVLASMPESKNNHYCIFTGGGVSLQQDVGDVGFVNEFYRDLPSYEVIQTHNPLVDFALIQECDKIILGYMSTFAWWSAYLSGKEVYAPSVFSTVDLVRKNYYPESFKLF
jgi:hypothetical protein